MQALHKEKRIQSWIISGISAKEEDINRNIRIEMKEATQERATSIEKIRYDLKNLLILIKIV